VRAKSSTQTPILLAAIAAGAVAVVLVGLVVFQQFSDPTDQSHGASQAVAPTAGSETIATQYASANTAATSAAASWPTVPFNEQRYTISMPSVEVDETVNDLAGNRHRESRPRDPRLKPVLLAGAYKGNDMAGFAAARVEQLRQQAAQSNPPGQLTSVTIEGRPAHQAVLREQGSYARHVVVVTSPAECVICSATTQGGQLTEAQVDHFISSLRLGPPMVAQNSKPPQATTSTTVQPPAQPAVSPIHLDNTITLQSVKARVAFRSDYERKLGGPESSLQEMYNYRTPDGGLLRVVVQELHSSDAYNYEVQLRAAEGSIARGEVASVKGGMYGSFRMIESRSPSGSGTSLGRFIYVGTKSINLTVLTSPTIPDATAQQFLSSLQINEPPPSTVAASDAAVPGDSEHPNAHLAEAFQKKIVRKTSGGWLLLKSHTDRCTFEMPEDAMQAVNVNDPGRSAEVFRYPLNLVDEEGKLAVNVTVTTANVREPIDRKFAQMEEAAKRNKDLKVETTTLGGYTMKQWMMEGPRYRMERVIFLDTNSFIIMTAETGTKVDRAMIERFLESIKL